MRPTSSQPDRPARPRLAGALGAVVACLALGTTAVVLPAGAGAAPAPPTVLVPIGSDYQSPTLERFAAAAAQVAVARGDSTVDILVLPITYSLDAFTTSKSERKKNLTLADSRRAQIETACQVVTSGSTLTCRVLLVPVLIRSDADLPANLALFEPTVDGMFTLGGDQTVAMQLVNGTQMERRMATLHASGTVFGGNSAGDAVQSLDMINGYVGANDASDGLHRGAIDVWTWDGTETDPTRGLIFGMHDTIAEQHVFERGRLGRALNVAVTYDEPVLGMDQATGGVLVDETQLVDVVGATAGLVVDPTHASAETFGGPNASLSVRDVVTHVVPPGSTFDLGTLRPGGDPVGPALPAPAYSLTKQGSGPLILSGGIAGLTTSNAVGQRFVADAGGAGATIVVLAVGYARSTDAQADAKRIATALQPGVTATVRQIVVDAKSNVATTLAAIQGASGIVLTAPDPSRVLAALAAQQAITDAVQARWQAGATLLADNAAAAAVGTRLSTDAPYSDIEVDGSADFTRSGVTIGSGLGWTNASVTPRLVVDYRWGQAYRALAAAPTSPSVGIDVATAVELKAGVSTVVGDESVVVLDGRGAAFGFGTNDGLRAFDVLVDVFRSGETVG